MGELKLVYFSGLLDFHFVCFELFDISDFCVWMVVQFVAEEGDFEVRGEVVDRFACVDERAGV